MRPTQTQIHTFSHAHTHSQRLRSQRTLCGAAAVTPVALGFCIALCTVWTCCGTFSVLNHITATVVPVHMPLRRVIYCGFTTTQRSTPWLELFWWTNLTCSGSTTLKPEVKQIPGFPQHGLASQPAWSVEEDPLPGQETFGLQCWEWAC